MDVLVGRQALYADLNRFHVKNVHYVFLICANVCLEYERCHTGNNIHEIKNGKSNQQQKLRIEIKIKIEKRNIEQLFSIRYNSIKIDCTCAIFRSFSHLVNA